MATIGNSTSDSKADSDDFVIVEASESTVAPALVSAEREAEEKTLDLVFVMDCTGSMGQYIDAAKKNIESIVTRIIQSESADVRFGLVAYRDHPPQESTYVTQVFDFVTNTTAMTANLNTLSAQGGGDGPEAVTAGLQAAKVLAYREDAAKVVVLIADAPPHGLGEAGDGFPNGDPDGLDPLVIAREMSNLGIAVYTVGCEPALSHYRFAKAFMISLSQLTGGKAVCLASAGLLADVILGGAIEEMDIQMLSNQLQPEIEAIRGEVRSSHVFRAAGGGGGYGGGALERSISEEEEDRVVAERLHERLLARGVQMAEMRTDGEMKDDFLSPKLAACLNLSDARTLLAKESPHIPTEPALLFGAGGGEGGGAGFMRCFAGLPSAPASAPASASYATRCEVVREAASFSSVSKVVSKASRGDKR
jgi:Mg-chelatase subunit ChlD